MILRGLDLAEKRSYNSKVNHPLQTWEWGDFRRQTGVEVERFGMFEGNTITGGLQLTFHSVPHTPFTIGYLPRGPMPGEEQIEALLQLGKKKNAIAIKIEPNVAAPVEKTTAHAEIIKFLLDHHMMPARPQFSPHTFILDLKPTEEQLLEGMKPKTRYNVHLAERKGVEIYEDTTEQGLEEYLKLQEMTTKRQQFYAHGSEYFRTMWKALGGSGMMRIFRAVYEGKTLVAWIMFIHNGVLYYPYGASSSEHRDLMASNLMMWRMIQFGKSQGCTSFDMWGALGPNPSPNDPWLGFHKFKEGYGAELYQFLGSFDLVVQPQWYNLYRMAEDLRWKFLRFTAKLKR